METSTTVTSASNSRFAARENGLQQRDAGTAQLLHPRFDAEQVVHAAGAVEVDVHAADDEGRGLVAIRAVDHAPCIGAEQAEEIGAPALGEANVGRVIDDAARVRIFEVDAHGQHVTLSRFVA